ncbi:MAG: hypothetical protein EOO10_25530 [Chitinophagaceae bacterium]|nr:MAG: hypothetical protein EOO10_25530 [Chitinophagaceae bacterium]
MYFFNNRKINFGGALSCF